MAEQENLNQIDQYQLVSCIATGGISQIWEIKHIANQQQFAMKLLLPEHLKDSAKKAELKSEANIAKQLEHPNIIRVLDVSIGRDNAYFVMEYFRGGNLKNQIRNEHGNVQARAKKIMETLAQTFAFIHDKGWVHKDIKPDNILVSRAGDVRVIDFSLASKPTGMLSALLTKKSSVVIQGTRTYLAPELIQRQPLTFSADIYSLGILFYELLTGRAPFVMGNANDLLMAHVREKPEKPSSYNVNLTPELDQLIYRMLAKKPKERIATMHEVYSAIRNLRIFLEDPETYLRNKARQDSEDFKDSMAHSLDSRTDANRTPEERARAAEEAAKTKAALSGKRKAALAKDQESTKGKTAPQRPAAPQPAAPVVMMPSPVMPYAPPMSPMGMPVPPMGMPMGYPTPGGYPGMPMPGMPYPGMPMPGQMMPPGMLPGAPIPGMPPAGYPSAAQPPRLPTPPAPVPVQPTLPAAPAPVATTPPRPLPPAPPKPVEDVPLMQMDELPEVM